MQTIAPQSGSPQTTGSLFTWLRFTARRFMQHPRPALDTPSPALAASQIHSFHQPGSDFPSVPETLADLQAAIADYHQWIDRLRQYGLEDRSAHLDADTVCQTDQCALSRWLQTSCARAVVSAADLRRLEQEHADFHFKASCVVALMQTGAVESALQSVQYGDFAQSSQRLMQHLRAMQDALTQRDAVC